MAGSCAPMKSNRSLPKSRTALRPTRLPWGPFTEGRRSRLMNQGVMSTPSATASEPSSASPAHSKPTASTDSAGLSKGMPTMRSVCTRTKWVTSAETRWSSHSGVG
ncbi:hypothetical protein Y695_03771 [Hydrogenophaga sp. T4]|nr:hypothetical protein Y695_03771 [Hydrogenophaga sp. T4]